MDLRQRRPSYDYISYLWPLAVIMVMVVVIEANISEVVIAYRREVRYYAASAHVAV